MRRNLFAAGVLLSAAVSSSVFAADAAMGRRQFAPCTACHTVEEGGPNKVGPNLHGILGRKAGSKSDYSYSTAMKKMDFVWDEQRIEVWITNPRAMVPGTKMAFIGVADPATRANIIAFLKDATR